MTEVAAQHLTPGTSVSRYEILEVLGAGGFGITYKVYDTRLQCAAAMKEYLPAEYAVRDADNTTVKPRSREVAGEFKRGLERFLDEARVLAKFKNRHIIRVSDYMETNGTAYLIMDYEEGRSLRQLLGVRGGLLSETEIRDIFMPILEGLGAVHKAGLLHRDIKPDNIYLREDGPPVLLDFGAARQYTASQTRSVTATVTPGYAPFEQYQPNGRLGAWTDLYGLGATLYACISGNPPIDAISRHADTGSDPLPPARQVGADRYSEELLQNIDWMLRPSISERPQSVDEVVDRLRAGFGPPQPGAASGSADVTARPPEPPTLIRVPPRPRSRRVGLIAGITAALAFGAGLGWWYTQERPPTPPVVGDETPQPADGATEETEQVASVQGDGGQASVEASEGPPVQPGQGDGEAATNPVPEENQSAQPAGLDTPAQSPSTAGVDDVQVTENVDEFLSTLMEDAGKPDAGGGTEESGSQGDSVISTDRIEVLLRQAEAYMAASNLVTPRGRNARAVYQTVLSLDADNPDALTGMSRIAAVYENAAATMLAEGHTDVGRRIVERGLEAVPGHPGLVRLQTLLAAQ